MGGGLIKEIKTRGKVEDIYRRQETQRTQEKMSPKQYETT
jgi:hypothetical protein